MDVTLCLWESLAGKLKGKKQNPDLHFLHLRGVVGALAHCITLLSS